MPRTYAFVVGVFCCLLCGQTVQAGADTPYERTENIVYKVEHGISLILDVFTPTGDSNGHGIIDTLSGAWFSENGQINDHLRAQVFDTYCSRGYTVFMIRPGSRTKFTAEEMVKNLKTGIRWVKAHAEEYKIDPEDIAITGASAGGHLTLLAVVTPEEGNPEAKDPIDRFDTRVKTAAVFFPPTDFLDWNGNPRAFRRLGDLFFKDGLEGHSEEEIRAKAEEISPARRVEETPPPILLIHGDADEVVPLQQSEKMKEAIEKAGGTVELIVKEGGGHPWMTIPEEVAVMADWFDKYILGE